MAESIKLEAIAPHSYNGKAYEVGDTYEFVPIDNPNSGFSVADQVDSLRLQGHAVRVDRAAVAKAAAKAAEASRESASKPAPAAKGAPKARKPRAAKGKK